MPIEPINPNNAHLAQYQVESGRMERESGEIINRADAIVAIDTVLDKIHERVDIVSGASVLNVRFPVTVAGVEARVGGAPLSGRHTLVFGNDSTTVVSISQTVNAPFLDAFKLFSGERIQISLDPTVTTNFFVRTEFFDTEIFFLEAKGATD